MKIIPCARRAPRANADPMPQKIPDREYNLTMKGKRIMFEMIEMTKTGVQMKR